MAGESRAPASPRRCIWCHQGGELIDTPSGDGGTVAVHAEHRAVVQAFMARATRWGRVFLLLMVLVPALAVLTTAAGLLFPALPRGFPAAVLLLYVGGIITALPLATPQTVRVLGLRRSIIVARLLGIASLASGLTTAALL